MRRAAVSLVIGLTVLAVAGVILPACSDGGRTLSPSTPTSVAATPVSPVTTVLSGTITDRLSNPIGGAVVTALAAGSPVAITDEVGHFALSVENFFPLPLTVSKEGYATRTQTVYTAQAITIRLTPSFLLQIDRLTTSELLPTDPPDYVGEPYESDYSWNTKLFSLPSPLVEAVIVEISWDGGEAGAVAMWAGNGTLTSATSATGVVLILPRGTTGALLVGRPYAAGKLTRPLAFTLDVHHAGRR